MRTLKRFETEAQFEEWKNSPQMRTPYTCLVTETGAVHYDEGSDDDYSVTFVYKFDDNYQHLVRFAGSNIAPNISPKPKDQHIFSSRIKVCYHRAHHDKNYWSTETNIHVYKNGEELSGEDLFGTYVDSDTPIYDIRDSYGNIIDGLVPNNDKSRNDRGNIRKFVYVKNGDTLKIVFSDLDTLPQGAFYRIDNVEEIIIGDGIKNVGRVCFKFAGAKKIYIGKNVENLDNRCFCGNENIYGNYCNKKLKNTEAPGYYEHNRMPKYSDNLIDMINKNKGQ